MVIKHSVVGYEAFDEFMNTFDSQGQVVHIYFGGSKDLNGESWCDDCIRAWPVIEELLDTLDPNSHFISVEVGDRLTWKDPNCPFRKDPRTRLMVLPTLLRWQCPEKLEGDQCEKPDLVSMLFTIEDDD